MSDVYILLEAAATGNLQVIQRLHGERGVDLNAQHKMNGYTALMWAVKRRHAPIVEFLLQHLTIEQVQQTRNGQGQTAMEFVDTAAIRQLFLDRGIAVEGGPLEEQDSAKENDTGFIPNYIRYPVITPELKAAGDGARGGSGGGGGSSGGFGFGFGPGNASLPHF